MAGNTRPQQADLEPTVANKPIPKNMWDVFDPSARGLESTVMNKSDQQQSNQISTETIQTGIFAGLPRGDSEIMRGAVVEIMRGADVTPGNTVKVQAIPYVPQTGLSSGIAVQAALVIGLLVFTAVLLSNKKRIAFGRFLKPVLFIVWFFALLLGAGVLSEIKNSTVASSNDPVAAGWGVAVMYGTFVALMGFLAREIWKVKAPTVAEEQVPIALHPKQDDTVYLVIATELDSGKTDRGMWTRLFAECDGDDAKTRAAYIRARAVQLQLNAKGA